MFFSLSTFYPFENPRRKLLGRGERESLLVMMMMMMMKKDGRRHGK